MLVMILLLASTAHFLWQSAWMLLLTIIVITLLIITISAIIPTIVIITIIPIIVIITVIMISLYCLLLVAIYLVTTTTWLATAEAHHYTEAEVEAMVSA